MRKSVGLAAAAVLTFAGLGVQTGSATGATEQAAQPVVQSKKGTAADAVKALLARPGAALLGGREKLHVVDTMIDADGASHVRMNRTIAGIPVLGGDVVVHQGPGSTWKGVSKSLTKPLTLSLTPALSGALARTAALSPTRATNAIRHFRAADVAPRLVVDALSGSPRLAYEIVTTGRQADGTPSRLTSIVDAKSGSVIRREEGIETVDGDGESLYSGDVPISVTKSGSSYVLTDAAHGNAVTTDMKNKTDSILCTLLTLGCTNGSAYSSADTSFGNGTNANRESAAVDAHYGGAVTFDYYKNVLGRNGIFGNGKGAPSRVHYDNGYVNAFWDGKKMTYGDGDGSSYGPLVSLDVAGHEMSHGVTENTAGLTYSGESGGLNEATSDIFGTMVEFYANNANDPGDYYIGEQFDLNGHQGLRRMDDPASDGASLNCFSADAKNVDVHYSSGIGNHFYYLLAEGSGAKTIGGKAHSSPTCDGSSVAGIGRDAAQKIWFRALTTYFTSGTTYAQARTGTLSAAKDLYGADSAQYAGVAASWTAVSVN